MPQEPDETDEPLLPDLEKPCDNCEGGWDCGHVCSQCNGTGYKLTGAGWQVWNMVRRQLQAGLDK